MSISKVSFVGKFSCWLAQDMLRMKKKKYNKLNHMIVTEVIDQDTVGEYAGMVVLFPK